LMARMEKGLGEVVAGLESWIFTMNEEKQGVSVDVNADRLKELADTLEARLMDDDTSSIDIIDELSAAGLSLLSGVLAAMRKEAENYDFEAVLGKLPELRKLIKEIEK